MRVLLLQLVLEVVDTVSCLLAVVGKALDLSAALHAPRHLHPPVHLLGDHAEGRHVFTRVVAKIEASLFLSRAPSLLGVFALAVLLSWGDTTILMFASKRRKVVIVNGRS